MSESRSSNDTLFDRIGGAHVVNVLVDQLYERVLNDPSLAPFFVTTPLAKLRTMQKEFFAAALDGPMTKSDISLARAHQGRGITREHLSKYTDHLLETLEQVGVGQNDAMAVVARIATFSNQILGDSTSDG